MHASPYHRGLFCSTDTLQLFPTPSTCWTEISATANSCAHREQLFTASDVWARHVQKKLVAWVKASATPKRYTAQVVRRACTCRRVPPVGDLNSRYACLFGLPHQTDRNQTTRSLWTYSVCHFLFHPKAHKSCFTPRLTSLVSAQGSQVLFHPKAHKSWFALRLTSLVSPQGSQVLVHPKAHQSCLTPMLTSLGSPQGSQVLSRCSRGTALWLH